MDPVLIVVLAVLGIVVIWWLLTYNAFIAKQNQCRNALSSIDVNFKKRHDLIPNIIESVKGYMQHEKELLTQLTNLREQAVSLNIDDPSRFNLENELTGAIQGLQFRAEAYPDLKASENFIHLQKTLTEVEEQISASRRAYNSAVERLNNGIQMFPSNIVAGTMGLKLREFFEAEEAEREPVRVDFSNS